MSKAQAVKVLRELHQNGDLEERTAGRVYGVARGGVY